MCRGCCLVVWLRVYVCLCAQVLRHRSVSDTCVRSCARRVGAWCADVRVSWLRLLGGSTWSPWSWAERLPPAWFAFVGAAAVLAFFAFFSVPDEAAGRGFGSGGGAARAAVWPASFAFGSGGGEVGLACSAPRCSAASKSTISFGCWTQSSWGGPYMAMVFSLFVRSFLWAFSPLRNACLAWSPSFVPASVARGGVWPLPQTRDRGTTAHRRSTPLCIHCR